MGSIIVAMDFTIFGEDVLGDFLLYLKKYVLELFFFDEIILTTVLLPLARVSRGETDAELK